MKLILALFVMLVSSTAFATDSPRKIDFTAVLTDQDGIALTDCIKLGDDDPKKCKEVPFTLGRASIRALTAKWPDEQNLDGREQFARADLGMRVYKSDSVALSSEDITLLKRLIAKAYGPMIIYRAWKILDPSAEK